MKKHILANFYFSETVVSIYLMVLGLFSPVFADKDNNPFGPIPKPPALEKRGNIFELLNAVFNLIVIVAGIYALFNLLVAGYQFMSAGGDPENIQRAWARIWQTLTGLVIVAGAFLLAALAGQIIFGDATIILNPKIE